MAIHTEKERKRERKVKDVFEKVKFFGQSQRRFWKSQRRFWKSQFFWTKSKTFLKKSKTSLKSQEVFETTLEFLCTLVDPCTHRSYFRRGQDEQTVGATPFEPQARPFQTHSYLALKMSLLHSDSKTFWKHTLEFLCTLVDPSTHRSVVKTKGRNTRDKQV